MYAKPSERAEAWRKKNPWFGTDNRLTALALAVHDMLLRDNVEVDSLKYYTLIDAHIRPSVSKWERKQKHTRK